MNFFPPPPSPMDGFLRKKCIGSGNIKCGIPRTSEPKGQNIFGSWHWIDELVDWKLLVVASDLMKNTWDAE